MRRNRTFAIPVIVGRQPWRWVPLLPPTFDDNFTFTAVQPCTKRSMEGMDESGPSVR
jgi:hypothetical protein